MPTLPTVKLLPPLVSGMGSSGVGFLLDLVFDFCLSASVLSLALRREFDLLLLPEDWSGADRFLAWPRLEEAVSGVLNRFAELESVCECPSRLGACVVPVMWLATAGSTEMMEARVLGADSEPIFTACSRQRRSAAVNLYSAL